MSDSQDLLGALRERAKELGCLYEVEKALAAGGCARNRVLAEVVEAIPPGWQYPEVCEARSRSKGQYATADLRRYAVGACGRRSWCRTRSWASCGSAT